MLKAKIDKLRDSYFEYKVRFDDYLYEIKWLRKIRHAYWRAIPYDCRPKNAWYNLKCRVWHRYTSIKPRYLPHTWCDRSHLLPHMMFEILSQFIEKECGPNCAVDWYYEDENYTQNKIKRGKDKKWVRDEMQELYDWWHKIYIPWQENSPELSNWAEFDKTHCISKWEDCEDGTRTCLFNPKFDSEESEKESHRLLQLTWKAEADMGKQLKKNLHRIVNIMDWMWT